MTMMIKADILKAMLVVAPTKDVRYYLNGILVEPSGAIVATDGHRVLVARGAASEDPEAKDVIIPTDAVKQALAGKLEYLTLTGNKLGNVEFTPCEGTFPEWRRVVPTEISSSEETNRAQFNASYVGDFGKIAKILTGNVENLHLLVPDPNHPAGVLFAGRDDVLGVLAPRKAQIVTDEAQWLAVRSVVVAGE
jgi:hypothetical protein